MRQLTLLFIVFNLFLPINLCAQVSEDYLNQISSHIVKMDETFDGRYPDYTIDRSI